MHRPLTCVSVIAVIVTTAGVAFLAGLGVKVIYAAFEALVNGVADRINPKPQPAPPPGS